MFVLPLNERHDRKRFDCGNESLNRWFAQLAGQHRRKLVSSTFVATESVSATEVIGFYSISLLELRNEQLPAEIGGRLPLRVPAFRLGRLAVATKHQGKKIGEFLLFDAIDRAMRTAQEVDGVALVVDAKDSAIGFYMRYGFEVMSDHPNTMFIPIRSG